MWSHVRNLVFTKKILYGWLHPEATSTTYMLAHCKLAWFSRYYLFVITVIIWIYSRKNHWLESQPTPSGRCGFEALQAGWDQKKSAVGAITAPSNGTSLYIAKMHLVCSCKYGAVLYLLQYQDSMCTACAQNKAGSLKHLICSLLKFWFSFGRKKTPLEAE